MSFIKAEMADGSKVSLDLLKDTVGFTGKNKLVYDLASLKLLNTSGTWNNNVYTLNNAVLTVNSNNTISVVTNGEVSANVIFNLASKPILPDVEMTMNGCPQGGSATTYELQYGNAVNKTYLDRGEGVSGITQFDYSTYPNSSVFIKIWATANISTAVLFKPMIYDASISDSTYEPHHDSVDTCKYNRSEANVLGAKNLLNVTADTVAQGGVTLTVDSEGIATLSGKSTSLTNYFNIGIVHVKRGVAYTLNGGLPDDANDGSQRLFANSNTAFGSGNRLMSCNDGVGRMTRVALADEDVTIQLQIMNTSKTYIASSDIIKPMIRLASDPDDTYAPFAMTNRELTNVALKRLKTLSSSDDLNNITEEGVYSVTTKPTNSPDTISYYQLIVIKRNDTDFVQVIIYGAFIYVRHKGQSWEPWFKFTGTEVS